MTEEIYIKGARSNNLKNVSLKIPRNQLIVVTGVSGSGKSSITMDTLFAEGQRRYVESLSSYARQFLMRMKKPEVDFIEGICPAIAIEQKVSSSNARSTVGTLTEMYDYLRLLYARVGKTYSPISGEIVKKHSVSDVVDFVQSLPEGSRVLLSCTLEVRDNRTLAQELDLLQQKGYSRLLVQGEVKAIDEVDASTTTWDDVALLVDRFVVKYGDEDNIKRIADSVLTAFNEGSGACTVKAIDGPSRYFNNRFELDGMRFEEPSPNLFNYNNPYGACPTCEGYGKAIGIDEEKVIPDPSLSVLEDCVAAWKGEKGSEYRDALVKAAYKFDFPVHRAYEDLEPEERKLLWDGNEYFTGINGYFKELEAGSYKIQNRVMLARYRGKTTCPTCDGYRLRQDALYVKVSGRHIGELTQMPVEKLLPFFEQIVLSDFEMSIAKRILLEVKNRLDFMLEVGLGYLTLDRLSATLSGGETQRINLTRTLGSNLTSSLYILDEPSIGLHPRDSGKLVGVLKSLRDLGNTVVVVEHEEDIIANADYLVDIGPAAGIHGGEVVFAGPYELIHTEAFDSLTAGYMSGRMKIPVPERRRAWNESITVLGARQHNLRNIDVTFPLNTLTVVTGVSGSGKTTLVKQILYPALKTHFDEASREKPGQFKGLEGSVKRISGIEMVNQSPIGKSSRSNPVTYVKAYDAIRNLFTKQQLSQMRGFQPRHFSFNVEGGRCENCQGEGETIVSMQFLADIRLECESCNGKRFKQEVLDVTFKEKNIFEVLDLSVDEALVFFQGENEVTSRLQPLQDVGLGYVKLGQSSSTLSGGEAQRVKLASFLGKDRPTEQIFFIFDEPTTGLHFHDIRKLLDAFNALVEHGHTVLVVEHNMEIIKNADWVIDLGPDAGDRGGELVFAGTPEDLAKCPGSFTGQYLLEKLKVKS
jgi:excinuclease ABC subunit A